MALYSYLVCLLLIIVGSVLLNYFKAAGIVLIVLGSLALVTLMTVRILLSFTPEGRALQGVLDFASGAKDVLPA